MVEAIGIEADRCRQSVENIVKHAIFEILHVPDYLPNNDSITSIQIFTLGSSSATYEALSQLGMSQSSDPVLVLCFRKGICSDWLRAYQ